MKRLLIALLITLLFTGPAQADSYKGTWYVVEGQVVREADLEFQGLPAEVAALSVGVATNIEFYPDGNYWVARNSTWDFYFAGTNGFYCRYTGSDIVCKEETNDTRTYKEDPKQVSGSCPYGSRSLYRTGVLDIFRVETNVYT